jgi:hypothetical protein
MCRNIIFDAHQIFYWVINESIEVMDVVHSALSILKIRGVRNICV